MDSYCDEIHWNAGDSQCLFGFNGTGPYLIQNNFIQAAGENIMFGGSDPAITNLVPSDITIVGNVIQKNTAWRGALRSHSIGARKSIELKNAQRVLLDGNVIQYTWNAGQDEAMIWRSVNQGGTCTWCVVQDVTATHNIIQHAPMGLVLAPIQGPSSTNDALPTQRILVRNNVFADISSATWGLPGWVYQISMDSTLPTMHDIIIDHNTSFSNVTTLNLGNSGTVNNFQFTNNISDYGIYGIFGNDVGPGAAALTTYLTNYVYNANALLNSSGSRLGGTWPSGTLWSTRAGVDFTNVTGTDPALSGDFQLTSRSPYFHAGTDGKDIGVWDWTCLNSDSAAALAGKFVPSFGCALNGELPQQPPTNLTAIVKSGRMSAEIRITGLQP